MKTDIQQSYDFVAAAYAEQFRDELQHKPFDRKMLDWLIEKTAGRGTLCDMGCGPGQVARYLHDQGATACGIDLSAEMVRLAAAAHPKIQFSQGNMLRLDDVPDNTHAGVAAFYSIIHVPKPAVVSALVELLRIIKPEGVLLLTHHIGTEIVHRDEFLGKQVSLDFVFFETNEMKEYLTTAGFNLDEVIERDPYPQVEYPSRRAYIFARKPGAMIDS